VIALRVVALGLVVLGAIAGFVYLVAFAVGDHGLAEFGLFLVAYEGASALHHTATAPEPSCEHDDDDDDLLIIEATREST
jgi:hypothetical protein